MNMSWHSWGLTDFAKHQLFSRGLPKPRSRPSAQVQAGEGPVNQAILHPPKPRGTWAGVQEKRIDR